MDLNQIRSFIAVTQTLNFTNAAHQNGVPQSTISRQINDLEQQLDARLFYRTKRDVSMTDEGRAFLPYALEMLEAEKKGMIAVRQLHDGAKGRLSITTIATSGLFLTKCLREFGEKYPNIAVDITYVSGGNSLLDQGEDPYDFHFMHLDMLPENDIFDSIATHKDQLCIIVPKNHRLADKPLSVKELANEKFVLVSEEESPILYMNVMGFFRSKRFSPKISNLCDDVKTVLLLVSAGLGISILPSSQPKEFMPDSLCAIPISEDDFSITYAAAWKKSLLNPAASLFLPVIKSNIESCDI